MRLMLTRKLPVVLGGLACLALATVAVAADWAQWRGPNRNDVVTESSGWAAGATPTRLWQKNVGAGAATPLIIAGKVYAIGFAGGNDTVYCFDAKKGDELWKQSYASKDRTRNHNADEGNYSGVLATPAFDAATGYLITLGCDGDLYCWDTAKGGAKVWGKNLFTDLGVKPRGGHDYGFTCSPVVVGSVVIVEATSPGGTYTALDTKTGTQKWASQYKGSAGHSGGPAFITVGGVECLAYLALHDIVVMRVDKGNEGKTLGTAPWDTAWQANIPSPSALGDLLFVTSGYGNPTKCYEVTAAGVKEKWKSGGSAKVCSPVPFKDSVYMVDGKLKCLDAATGKVKWEGGDFGGASSGNCLVTAGDNKVIAFGGGKLVLLEAGAASYAELAKVEGVVPGLCYPQVTIADGIICCKDFKGALTCYSVGAAAATK
jgi:outer membrane protein assembly factor BamB